jgi:hypothetical protein
MQTVWQHNRSVRCSEHRFRQMSSSDEQDQNQQLSQYIPSLTIDSKAFKKINII